MHVHAGTSDDISDITAVYYTSYYCCYLYIRFYECFVCHGNSHAVCTGNQESFTNKESRSAIGLLI